MKKRETTPQTIKMSENSVTSLTPLRSNLKKPSAVKSNKRVVIQDPAMSERAEEMMYALLRFFMKKIMNYQQEGFDGLVQECQTQKLKQDQITRLHQCLLRRQVFNEWLAIYQKLIKVPSMERDEKIVLNYLARQHKTKLIKNIFFIWKRMKNQSKFDSSVQSQSLKSNLNKFLEGDDIKPIKSSFSNNSYLKKIIDSFKAHFPKRIKKKIGQMTPSHQSKRSLLIKSSQSKESLRATPDRSKSKGIARILFTETSEHPSSRQDQSFEKFRKNPSAGRLFDSGRRSPSQPTNKFNQISHRKNLSNFNSTNNIDRSGFHPIIMKIQKKRLQEAYQVMKQLKSSPSREGANVLSSLVPQIKVDKFQLQFKLQKLMNSIIRPYFRRLKAHKKKIELKHSKKISQFLGQ